MRPKIIEPKKLVEAVETIRRTGAEGIVLFYAGAFTDEHARALGNGPFSKPARLPFPDYINLASAPPNLIQNAGFEDGLEHWQASEHAAESREAAAEGAACVELAGTGEDDSKIGCETKLSEPTAGYVKLSFAGKVGAVKPGTHAGITVRFDFADGTHLWQANPWRLTAADAGRWTRKVGFYRSDRPITSLGVWCINYRNSETAFFDDVFVGVFPSGRETK